MVAKNENTNESSSETLLETKIQLFKKKNKKKTSETNKKHHTLLVCWDTWELNLKTNWHKPLNLWKIIFLHLFLMCVINKTPYALKELHLRND